MIVVGSKKHSLFIEEGRHDGVENGVGFTRAGRALDIGHRVFHGIVDGQQLVHVDPLVDQGDGAGLPGPGAFQQIPEKRLDGHGNPVLPVQFQNGLVFLVQVQGNVHAQADDIRHIVHQGILSAGVPIDAVLDPLLVSGKVPYQFVILRVQISADALRGTVHRKLRAHGDLLVRAQHPPLDVQIQAAVGQHMQSPGQMDAQHVHGKLLQPKGAVPALRLAGLVLKLFHDLPKLLLAEFIDLPHQPFPVQIADQLKIRYIGSGIQTVAHLQIA